MLLVILMAGCGGLEYDPSDGDMVYPGDGRLITVLPDESWGHRFVQLADGSLMPEVELLRAGAHYWDSVGARLRLPGEDPGEGRGGPYLPVHRSGESPDRAGWYQGDAVTIVAAWSPRGELSDQGVEYYSTICAHEFGHALGMEHLPEGDAVMYYAPGRRPDLSEWDADQFFKKW
jgi:Matrixin